MKGKDYRMDWITPDAEIICLEEGTARNLKQVLFNEVCKMLVETSFFYDPKNPDNIMKAIKSGKTFGREYHTYLANGHALSITEVKNGI